ncbi:MAG TPA: plasmid replication, integration and excision activator [Mycobacteriales bacterium]|jgi:hypothetical protein|nr:plasmid replication, integration and excision activator [Mycobacteriales bacterium]
MTVVLPMPVPFENVFPAGCFVTSAVTPISSYVDGKPGPQTVDEATGHPLWQVMVHDPDEEARGTAQAMKVKIISEKEPELPPQLEGLPFRPVVFEGLMIRPYATEVMQGRWKVAYSLTAHGMRAPEKTAGKPVDSKPAGKPA